VDSELTGARFALRRIVLGLGSPASREAAAASLRHAGQRLDELLLAPVRAQLGDRPLVVVPTGNLHAMPWSVLPSCQGRPVCVAPSAAAWHRAAGYQPASGHTALVAGPGLAESRAEVADLAAIMPGATVLSGQDATVDRVLAALGGASVAHVAAHASFRGDSPFFSQLRLWDGPATVYDLERLSAPPRLLVLSACEAGLSAVHNGDELIGPAAAILRLGTATVMATVGPVSDTVSRALMRDFHLRRLRGATVAAALAEAQLACSATMSEAATAAHFVCLGAG
jgi:CHAT domain-containing protein